MLEDHIDQMRSYIVLAETLHDDAEALVETVVVEPVGTEPHGDIILSELADIAFRLRGFMESEGGDFALGVETGMQRAAEMIENLIRRHTEEETYVG